MRIDKLTPELVHGFSERFLRKDFDGAVPTPPLHLEMWELMCSDNPQVAVAAPRGHAKSTSVTLTFTLAAMLFGFRDYCLIVSQTLGQSKEFLRNIANILQENEEIKTLFGIQTPFVTENQETIIVQQIDTDGTKRQFRISCKGSEQALRGMLWGTKRPDLIIGDDLEGDEQVQSDERREKFRTWMMDALMPAGAPKKCLFRIVGTILHFDSYLYRLMPRPADPATINTPLKMYSTNTELPWISVLYRAHPSPSDFSEILWQDLHSESSLRRKRDEYLMQGNPEGYNKEYLNDPIASENAFFSKDDIVPLDEDSTGPWEYYTGVDLAISEKQRRAYTAMVTIRINSEQVIQIVDVRRYRGDTLEHINNIFEIHMKYRPEVMFLEEENIARTMTPLLEKEINIRKQYPNLEYIRVGKDKHTRARPLQARFRAGTIEFDTEKSWWPDLQNELIQFPSGPYKDQVDALSIIFLGFDKVFEAPTDQEYEDALYEDEMEDAGLFDMGRSFITGY